MTEQTTQVQTPEKKKKRRGSALLLVLLIIVVLLFILTTVMLGSRLYSMTTRDRYSVDLTLGEADGSIELFNINYQNSSGEITVKGINGQQVVAPGTDVTYDVRLRNKDDVVIDFIMTPSVEFYTEDHILVHFKIVDDYGNYVLGSEDTWESAEAMNALAHKGAIHPGEVYTYHVAWQWVFEQDNDEYDTMLGNSDDAGLTVGFGIQSSPSSVEPKTPSHLSHLLGEGFGCCWCCWLVWFLVLVLLIMVLWICKLKRTIRKLDQQVEEYEQMLK